MTISNGENQPAPVRAQSFVVPPKKPSSARCLLRSSWARQLVKQVYWTEWCPPRCPLWDPDAPSSSCREWKLLTAHGQVRCGNCPPPPRCRAQGQVLFLRQACLNRDKPEGHLSSRAPCGMGSCYDSLSVQLLFGPILLHSLQNMP